MIGDQDYDSIITKNIYYDDSIIYKCIISIYKVRVIL